MGLKSLPALGSQLFDKVWNDDRISSRRGGFCILVPLLCSLVLLCAEIWFFRGSMPAPYLVVFIILIVSACFGGARSAFAASVFSFIVTVILQFFFQSRAVPHPYNLSSSLLYLAEALFFTALIHGFQLQRLQNRRHLRALEESQQKMIVHERGHDNFVHRAVHELKSPVTVLKAYLQLLMVHLQKENLQAHVGTVEKMDAQVDKIFHLITDMLDGAKAGSGSLHILMNDFDLNESLRLCAANLKASYPNSVIDLEISAGELLVYADRERIEQVINNLLTNGIKYSPGEKYIRIWAGIEGNSVIVRVKDRGMGIPEDKQAAVFEQFFRVDPDLGQGVPGLGLGLFICTDIIRRHQGEIGVISKEGEGAEFWFTIPYRV